MVSLIGSLQKLYYQAQSQTGGGPAPAEQIQKLDELRSLEKLEKARKIPEMTEKIDARDLLKPKRRKR